MLGIVDFGFGLLHFGSVFRLLAFGIIFLDSASFISPRRLVYNCLGPSVTHREFPPSHIEEFGFVCSRSAGGTLITESLSWILANLPSYSHCQSWSHCGHWHWQLVQFLTPHSTYDPSSSTMPDKENKIVCIHDTHIGMTQADMVNSLSTIAKSGTKVRIFLKSLYIVGVLMVFFFRDSSALALTFQRSIRCWFLIYLPRSRARSKHNDVAGGTFTIVVAYCQPSRSWY